MNRPRRLARRAASAALLAGLLTTTAVTAAGASSHREAPAITEDPVADLTDVYAFNSPDAPGTVTLIANVNPFELPAGGPNFHRFGDDVLYRINVDNDGDAKADLRYEFRFRTETVNPDTFLYNTGQVTELADPDLSVRQYYAVTEVDTASGRRTVLGQNLPVAPANVGVRSTPDYEANLGSKAVQSVAGGIKVFAGPRDDPFFVDLGSIFDLAGLRPLNPLHLVPLPEEAGKDYVAGLNVHTMALQVPASRLTKGSDPVIGVWATTSRRAVRVFEGNDGDRLRHAGGWVQVSRLGMPLVNEAVIPLGQKDTFNASPPSKDGQFLDSVLAPELGRLIPVLYPVIAQNGGVPQDVDLGLGLGGREDLATVFLTGIPGFNKPATVTPSEMLRLNTARPDLDFPFSGRSLGVDVTDIELQALAGATPLTPEFNTFPRTAITDGVSANDRDFLASFPYVAPPHDGYSS
jgi:hypothetical protein